MAGGLIIWAFSIAAPALTGIAAPDAPPPGDVGRASLLLLILAVLLGVLLLAIALMTVIRRLRHRSSGQPAKLAKPLADPWQESANRVRMNKPPPGASEADSDG